MGNAFQGSGEEREPDSGGLAYQGLQTESLVRPIETIHVEATSRDVDTAKKLIAYAVQPDADKNVFDMIMGYVRDGHVDLLVAVGLTTTFVLGFLGKDQVVKTLLDAASGALPEQKILILEVLVEVARYPQHRGGVAGSGILGVVCAMALSEKGNIRSRALALTALSVLPLNPFERSADPYRELEYKKLREQLEKVGLPKVCVGLIAMADISEPVFEACVTATVSLLKSADMIIPFINAGVIQATIQQVDLRRRDVLSNTDANRHDELESEIQALVKLFHTLVQSLLTFKESFEADTVIGELKSIQAFETMMKTSSVSRISSRTVLSCLEVSFMLSSSFGIYSEISWSKSNLTDINTMLCREIAFSRGANTTQGLLMFIQNMSQAQPKLLIDPFSLENALKTISDAEIQTEVTLTIGGLPPYCSNCRTTSQLRHCGRCKSVSYCSRECQIAHYKQHRPFCLQQSKYTT